MQNKGSLDDNWEEIRKFIIESREYRTSDNVKQDYQIKSVDDLREKVKIQNGRVFSLEKWKEEIELRIKQRKDNYATMQAIITIGATVVMAISATVMIFKK